MAHPLYFTWTGMIQRCENTNVNTYRHYGGRGITVCGRWRGKDGFANFVADMGPKPSPKYSIDRIDNDGPYSPENCRWATREEQAANRRPFERSTHRGRGRHQITLIYEPAKVDRLAAALARLAAAEDYAAASRKAKPEPVSLPGRAA